MAIVANAPLWLVESSSNRLAIGASDLAAAFSGGEFDFEITFIAGQDCDAQDSASPYLFYMTTPQGECSLQLVQNASLDAELHFKLTGNLAANVQGATSIPTMLAWQTGDVVSVRCWYRPVTLPTYSAGVRMTVNGVTSPDWSLAAGFTAGGGSLSAATSGWLGSNGSSNDLNATFIRLRSFESVYVPRSVIDPTPECIVLGDSTVTEYRAMISVSAQVYDQGQRYWKRGIGNNAVVGDTTAGQLSKFQALPWYGDASIKAIILQTGINDTGTSAQIIAGYQSAVNTIKAAHPYAKLYVSKCIPWANSATVIALNQAIAGGGTTPITGADGAITSHYTTLGGGTDSLLSQYLSSYGNHENNAGRVVVGQAYRSFLQTAGLL